MEQKAWSCQCRACRAREGACERPKGKVCQCAAWPIFADLKSPCPVPSSGDCVGKRSRDHTKRGCVKQSRNNRLPLERLPAMPAATGSRPPVGGVSPDYTPALHSSRFVCPGNCGQSRSAGRCRGVCGVAKGGGSCVVYCQRCCANWIKSTGINVCCLAILPLRESPA